MLDGVEISSEEKVKAENLHGYDLQSREIIFKSLLPDEKFVDRRVSRIEDVAQESDSDEDYVASGPMSHQPDAASAGGGASSSQQSLRAANSVAKHYVGELISRVDFNAALPHSNSPRFIQET